MQLHSNKIKLAPRLRWGIGKDHYKLNFFKISGGIFIALSAVLIIRATYLLFSDKDTPQNNTPQVLGATDNSPSTQVFTDYKVKKGDTLFTISQEYGVEWSALATLNNLEPPFTLHANQTLKIPKNR